MFYLIDVEALSVTELRFNKVWRLRLEDSTPRRVNMAKSTPRNESNP